MQTSITLSNNDTLPQLLAYLNTSLSSYQDFPHNITKALQKLGEYSQHDRIHIVEIQQNMTFNIIHEWAIREVGPTPEKWKHAPIIHQHLWEEQLCANNHIDKSCRILADIENFAILQRVIKSFPRRGAVDFAYLL